jgi:hypothetical protein
MKTKLKSNVVRIACAALVIACGNAGAVAQEPVSPSSSAIKKPAPVATKPPVRKFIAEDLPTAKVPHKITMLTLDGKPADWRTLDFATLPVVGGEHAVVSAPDAEWGFRLHNYLIHHDGRYWCMWSHGPKVEDWPTQHVRYAVSDDGLKWSEARPIMQPPADPYAFIARGFWLRDGELLALAARYKGHGAFGVDKELTLEAYVWDKSADAWKHKGRVYDNAINNFAPQKLSSGPWMTTRRDARFNCTMLVGGVKALDDWKAFPVSGYRNPETKFAPDEPIFWEQPDGRLVAAFRDNGGSMRLFQATSNDQGRTWTKPELTNYPNATSKVYSLRLAGDGPLVLIGNANPKIGRREMYVGLSDDGLTFTRLVRLDIPSPRATTFQYPHAIEHDGHLLIAFSNKKTRIEVLKVPVDRSKVQ